MASNFLEILSQLHDRHVEFVIVGGVAAALHGGSRVTFDLDVVARPAAESSQGAADPPLVLRGGPRAPRKVESPPPVEKKARRRRRGEGGRWL